jgi:polygalacturonase
MEAELSMAVAIVSPDHNFLAYMATLTITAWYAAGETGPIPWTIYNAENVLVENINMVQSPFWHNFVYQSSNVTFNNINLHSIQTDGTQAQNTGKISFPPMRWQGS